MIVASHPPNGGLREFSSALVSISMSVPRLHLGRALILGVAAPLTTGILIAISISLNFSAHFAFAREGEFDRALARANAVTSWLQQSGPVLGRVLLLVAALWVGRRAVHQLEAVALLLGSCLGTFPFVIWMGGGSATLLASALIDAAVIALGTSLGRRGLIADQALAAATKSIRSAASLHEIAVALATFVGGRAVLLVDDGEHWRSVADSDGETIELERLAISDEDEARWLPPQATLAPALCIQLILDHRPMGFLLLAARRLRARRRTLTQSLAAQVSLAWHRLELLDEARRAALARERERVSHEIHDTLAQDLISAIMHMETAEQQLESGRGDAGASLGRAETIVRRCLQQARDLVWSSWRSRAAGSSLAASLRLVSERWAHDNDIAVQCQTVGGEAAIAARTESLLLSAAREALANVRKHAHARAVNMTLSYIDGMVALDVQDDGRGFDAAQPTEESGGFGLAALRERAERIGGRLIVESRIGEGTVLSIQIPRQENGG